VKIDIKKIALAVKKIDWKALAIEWLYMLIVFGLTEVTDLYVRFIRHGEFPDVRTIPILLMGIAATIQTMRNKNKGLETSSSLWYWIATLVFGAVIWFWRG